MRRLCCSSASLPSLSALLTGCIVWEEPWWQQYPPRAATFYVYVYDYYSGVPIPWAAVELYEEGWWSWDYAGTWPVSPYGYAVVTGGYLEYDGGGYDEETFRVVAFAEGYYTESCQVSVSYYEPGEDDPLLSRPVAPREGASRRAGAGAGPGGGTAGPCEGGEGD